MGGLAILTERYLYHRFWLHGAVLSCLVVSVGLTQVMQNGALLVFGIYEKNVDSVFSGTINFFGLRYSLERFMLIVFAYLIIAGLMVFLNTSKRGQAMRAVAQDYDAARLLGINPKRIAMLGMFIGVGLAAVAGAIIAPVYAVSAYMGEFMMIKAFLVIVIGGLGSVPGALIGALLIGMFESFGLTYFGHITNVYLFVFVILVMVVRPTGLFSGTIFQIGSGGGREINRNEMGPRHPLCHCSPEVADVVGQSVLPESHHLHILFSVVVLGYWLIHRTGQVSFAQGGFLMIGAYTSAALMKHLDFNFCCSLPLAGVVAAVVALAIGIPTPEAARCLLLPHHFCVWRNHSPFLH